MTMSYQRTKRIFSALLYGETNSATKAAKPITIYPESSVETLLLEASSSIELLPGITPGPDGSEKARNEGSHAPSRFSTMLSLAVQRPQTQPTNDNPTSIETVKGTTRKGEDFERKQPVSIPVPDSEEEPKRLSVIDMLKSICIGTPEVAFMKMLKAMQSGNLKRITWKSQRESSISRPCSAISDRNIALLDSSLELPTAGELKLEFESVFQNLDYEVKLA
ncbi:hypothetical protein BDR26DRAFT_862361 [Obelidium mucronatum]|nr:hypothetical protein BDR26DRAFT_862361 [Obelidium mucronatum]